MLIEKLFLEDSDPQVRQAIQFIDSECLEALAAIRGPSANKKRTAVIRLAISRASGLSMRQALDDARSAPRTTWYHRWRHEPEVMRAYHLLLERAFVLRDTETIRVEIVALNERRRALACAGIDAIHCLSDIAKNSDNPRARLDACKALLGLSDPIYALRISLMDSGNNGPSEAWNLNRFDPGLLEELDRLADEYERSRERILPPPEP